MFEFAADKFDYEGLCEALEQLSEFEKKANDRVIESGVLKGLNLDDIKRAGEKVNSSRWLHQCLPENFEDSGCECKTPRAFVLLVW